MKGSGVISTWQVEFPSEFRQFDDDTISDCLLAHPPYREGGELLKQKARHRKSICCPYQDSIRRGIIEPSD
ncbi:MAG: hypothetical protein ACREA9_26045 [Pyrinomonadaceae bacterium]